MQRIAWGIVCAGLVALAIGVAGIGRQLVVSKDGGGAYRSVQGAMNEAQFGDTILVNPGIYEEQIEFKNGVTVTGSGTEQTIIRYGYGFDEVLHAQNVVSGRVERLTLERTGSVLDAPVVVLESAALTFSECVITGGTEDGIRIGGLSAWPAFVDCEIVGNRPHGISCEGGAVVKVVGGSVRRNAGTGILLADAQLTVERTHFEANGVTGLVTQGDARATILAATFDDHPGWGAEACDAVGLTLTDCRFIDNGSGGLRIQDEATAVMASCRFVGGAVGIEARGSSRLELDGGGVRGTGRVGLRVGDAATARIERIEIVDGGGVGIELDSAGSVSVRFATIAGNGSDGVVATGTTVELTNSIVALNGGAGLRVTQDPSASNPPTFAHNAVWGNAAGDYVGTTRRSSDLASYPAFVDTEDQDYSLRLDSPCVGAGEGGVTVGAHPDPTRTSGTAVDVTVRYGEAPWGLGVAGAVRLASVAPFFEQGRLLLEGTWPRASCLLESTLLGAGSDRLRVGGALRLLQYDVRSPNEAGSALVATVGVESVLDGEGSRTTVWTQGKVVSDAYAIRTELEWERPTGISRQALDLELGGLSLSARATCLTLNTLDLLGDIAVDRSAGRLAASAGLSMLPERAAFLNAEWSTEGWGLEATARLDIEDLAGGEVSVTWRDRERRSRIDLEVEVADRAIRDVAVRAAIGLGPALVSSEIGVHTTLGVRLRLAVDLETTGWFSPRVNTPPLPGFSYGPYEPEAGEPVVFDGAESADEDGRVMEYWWDFGDGTVGLGSPVTHAFAAAGEYEVALTVSDDDGDTTMLVQSVTILEADTTPVASFTWEPISDAGTSLPRPLRAGDRVGLDAGSSYDPDGTIVEFAWDLESDGIFDLITDRPRASIDPLDAGTWPITLRVLDDGGRADAVMRVLRVEEPKPPQAAFSVSPATPSIYDPIRFIDRSLGIDGSIISWEWLFGDGHASREPEPIHRYEKVGRYEVRLTVTDSTGLRDTYLENLEVQRTPDVVPVDKVWALVIGISDYQEVEDLPYARRDGEAIVGWLVEHGVPPEQIRWLSDREGELATPAGPPSAEATLVNVREGLGWLRRVAAEDDLVVIHFSGHGYQGADDGVDEVDGVDEFFVLLDTRAAAKDDTALRDDEFGRFLDRIGSDHVLVFFDSCYSGGLSRSLLPGRRAVGEDEDWFGDLRLEGRLVLSAASEGEEAFESPELERGVFTHFLLEGLDGAADLNGDYHVTVWELYEYVAARVPDFVAAERGETQRPQLLGEGETRIILSVRDRPLEAAFSYCPSVPYAGGAMVFIDESVASALANRIWSFGDGTTGRGARIVHAYEEPGAYEVTLVVEDEAGRRSDAWIEVRVEAGGCIETLDEEADHAIVSLGARNGVRIGDRFRLDRPPDVGGPTAPVLEVTELLDEDRAACRIVDGEGLQAGDSVAPVDPPLCSPVGEGSP